MGNEIDLGIDLASVGKDETVVMVYSIHGEMRISADRHMINEATSAVCKAMEQLPPPVPMKLEVTFHHSITYEEWMKEFVKLMKKYGFNFVPHTPLHT